VRALREAVVEMRRDLAASALEVAAQGSAFGERLGAVAQLVDRLESGAATRFDGVSAELRATASRLAEGGAAQAAQLAAFDEAASARAEQAEARLLHLAEQAEARLSSLSDQATRSEAAAEARLASFAERAAEVHFKAEEHFASLAERAARVDLRAEQHLASLAERAAQVDLRAEGHFASLAERASQVDLRAGEHFASLAERTVEVEARAEQRFASLAERTVEIEARAEQRITSLAERTVEVEARAEQRFASLAEQVRGGLEAQAALIRDFTAASAAQVAESDARAAARLDALIQASEQVLLGQGERLLAFEQRLEGSRGAGAEALADKLAGFARGLGEELRQTATLVREASDLLRAGGAEMATVAEMFTGAVDRYRDASDRWLGNLGAIEDAIARKDGSADGLLGAYLDQTREVFDHSLQFQRELFLELRALKSKTS
jgi:DNA-binding ferritin-like protein